MHIPDTAKRYMSQFLKRLPLVSKFFEHPEEVCMNYYSHLSFSLRLTKLHAYGTFVSAVHAVFPWMYTNEVSHLNQKIRTLLIDSGCQEEDISNPTKQRKDE